MRNEIEKLIDKHEDKSLEIPEYYFQCVEFIEDLQSLLKLYQGELNEIAKGKAKI